MLVLAETLVSAFCHALGFDGTKRRPRVDVYELAERAGAEAKIEQSLREDGRVEDSPMATRIFLWSTTAETRRRFTLGHELGHLVLSDPKVFRLVQLEFGGERFHVEHLCDAFSAELLMPRRWLSRRYEGAEEGLDVLNDLVHEAEVSYSAGFTRLTHVLQWHSSLFYLRRADWSLSLAGGSVRHADLELEPDSLTVLRGLRASSGRYEKYSDTASVSIEIRFEDDRHRLNCETLPTRNGIWLLAALPGHAAERSS